MARGHISKTVAGNVRGRDSFRFMREVPACPQCGKADVEVEEWTRIARDGTRLAEIILTCGNCNIHFKPDGELLTLSSWKEVQRDGTPAQQHAFTEDEKKGPS
jgi:hypothetical protein